MSTRKPICHSKKVVAQSGLFTIEQLSLEFSNGEHRTYERMKGPPNGAVLMVPLIGDSEMLMIKEYAAGTDRYELGFPMGLIDAGEDRYQAANRELQEEVGYAAAKLDHIRTVSLAPGYSSARMEIVLARDLTPSKLEGDEPEPLEVISWDLNDMDALLARPDFTEARSIAAIFLVREWLSKNKS